MKRPALISAQEKTKGIRNNFFERLGENSIYRLMFEQKEFVLPFA